MTPNETTAAAQSRWKLYLGLSRTPHGLLDVATPAMAALLWLGYFPPLPVIAVGLVTAFAGYNAVYALNDLIDYRIDSDRLAQKEDGSTFFHVDEVLVRHPIAKGLLSFQQGVTWCVGWGIVAVIGALWLNPACVAVFFVSACCEALYCRLLKVTHLKIIPSAIVKSSGGLAGVLAVDPSPVPGFLAVLLLWLAAWEVGGQNIANDIVDREDDLRVAAKTTATVLGVQESVFRVLVAVAVAWFGGLAVYWFAGEGIGRLYPIGAVLLGWYLLIAPARMLFFDPGPATASNLFNKASYMPVCFLALAALSLLAPL